MSRMRIVCPKCREEFEAEAIHSGFNDSEFLYCGACHRVAVLNIYSPKSRLLLTLGNEALWAWRTSAEDKRAIEAALERCPCGGVFSFDAKAKCPRCLQALGSPLLVLRTAATAPESWAPKDWQSIYCLIIERGAIADPFKQ